MKYLFTQDEYDEFMGLREDAQSGAYHNAAVAEEARRQLALVKADLAQAQLTNRHLSDEIDELTKEVEASSARDERLRDAIRDAQMYKARMLGLEQDLEWYIDKFGPINRDPHPEGGPLPDSPAIAVRNYRKAIDGGNLS